MKSSISGSFAIKFPSGSTTIPFLFGNRTWSVVEGIDLGEF